MSSSHPTIHYTKMPSVVRFLPALVGSFGRRAGRSTRPPPLEVSAPWQPADGLSLFREVVSDTRDLTPPTFPAARMTPLLVSLVAHRAFPFPAIGLVHRREEIRVLEALPVDGEAVLAAQLGEAREVPAGVCFDIHTRALVEGRAVWEAVSEIVWRAPGGRRTSGRRERGRDYREQAWVDVDLALARRYAVASGNRDPIHTMPRVARCLGMPGAVMHGLWTMARAFAFLPEISPPFRVEARFRRPVVVPAQVSFGWDQRSEGYDFGAWNRASGAQYMTGCVSPLDA